MAKNPRRPTDEKFKVGDKVRIRQWEDMEKEWGLNGNYINTPGSAWFTPSMRKYCGKCFTISGIGIGEKDDVVKGHKCGDVVSITFDMLEYADEEPKVPKNKRKPRFEVELTDGTGFSAFEPKWDSESPRITPAELPQDRRFIIGGLEFFINETTTGVRTNELSIRAKCLGRVAAVPPTPKVDISEDVRFNLIEGHCKECLNRKELNGYLFCNHFHNFTVPDGFCHAFTSEESEQETL